MSNESVIKLNMWSLSTAVGSIITLVLAYGDLRHQVISGNDQSRELREIIKPLVEKVNTLERDVDRLKVEIDRFPKSGKVTVDNIPIWKYEK